ncbi:MAG: hypothetical protein MUC67_05540 [Acidobacteria bacterium]|jgi:hypothetical protein|nr:hypothetical protein [Acidobacteriota bacterium]
MAVHGEHALETWQRLYRAAQRWGGEGVCELADEPPALLWLYGSTMIEASRESDGSVALRAFLVMKPSHPDPARVCATYQPAIPAGRLRVDEEGDIILEHRIAVGVDDATLDAELRRVCEAADSVDDLIREEAGGILAFDLFEWDVMQAVRGELP